MFSQHKYPHNQPETAISLGVSLKYSHRQKRSWWRIFFSSQHPKLKALFPPGGVKGSELSYTHGLTGEGVGKCWPVLLLHSLLGTCEMKRRLWKAAILLETPFGLRIHSEELTNPLQFYLFGIYVACCKWGWRTVWMSWFEAEQASPCLVPPL